MMISNVCVNNSTASSNDKVIACSRTALLSFILLLTLLTSSRTSVNGFCSVRQKQVPLVRNRTLVDINRGGDGGAFSSSSTALNFLTTAAASVDAFFRTAPYTAAFVTCGLQSSLADLLAQIHSARQVKLGTQQQPSTASAVLGDKHRNTNVDEDTTNIAPIVESRLSKFGLSRICSMFDVKRNLSFLLYGGFYLGCAFEWLYNTAYPKMFGDTISVFTVLGKVVVDLLILAPLVTLPISYVIKALVYGTSVRQELLSYWNDVRQQHVLSKYCAMYLPVTIVAFTLIPAHYRVSFFAIVDFSWVLLLSSISS
jgi:hypothetical protein